MDLRTRALPNADRLRLLMRIALVLYWPTLAAATHWPRLQVTHGDFADIGLDKWLHIGCFGLLAVFLIGARIAGRRARPITHWFVGWAVAAAYAALDETTQRWFDGREPSLRDFGGNLVGILAAAVVCLLAPKLVPLAARPPVSGSPDEDTGGQAASGTPATSRSNGFVGNARIVSILTLVSRVTGLLRESIMAAYFGRGPVVAAFVFAFQLPNLFRRLFGEGALSAALIPIYTDLLKKDPLAARRFASLSVGLLVAALGALTLLGELVLFALMATRDWPAETALALRLMAVMLPYMPLICLVAVLGALSQVHGRFAPSAGAPILLNVIMITGILIATRGSIDEATLARRVYIVAWSVIAAGVLQLAWQLASLLRFESFTREVKGATAPMRELMKIFLPMVLGLAVFQINTFIDNVIAFGLAPKEGGPPKLNLFGWHVDHPLPISAVADLGWASRLYEFPLGIFGIAIATAIFPALAHAAAEAQGRPSKEHFRTILRHGLRLTVFIGLPASVGLLLVRLPLVRLAYERKEFRLEDSIEVAKILAAFAPAIWAYSMNHVITRAFYALKDSKTPLKISLAMVGLNLVLNLTLVWPLGAAGMGLATAICAMLQNVFLLRAIRKYVDEPIGREVWASWGRTALLTLIMTAALLPILWWFDPRELRATHSAILLAVLCAVGAGVVLLGARLMRLEELRWLLGRRAE